jgi:A/G-specific adenine glycosylase
MAEWAGLGYYARARNLLKCARAVAGDRGGVFPDTERRAAALPGIGPYTAAAIAAIAFDRPETVVDGNVERVMARLFDGDDPLPGAKPEPCRARRTLTPPRCARRHAQAVMDLGATICTPRAPACGICPLARALRRPGARASRPTCRARRRRRPSPCGRASPISGRRADGAGCSRRGPPRGLLGGMLGWPGTDWAEDAPPPRRRCAADWRDPGPARCATPSRISTCDPRYRRGGPARRCGACARRTSFPPMPSGPAICPRSCARPSTWRVTANGPRG